eukprot:2197522-Rhodomonas_salina.5
MRGVPEIAAAAAARRNNLSDGLVVGGDIHIVLYDYERTFQGLPFRNVFHSAVDNVLRHVFGADSQAVFAPGLFETAANVPPVDAQVSVSPSPPADATWARTLTHNPSFSQRLPASDGAGRAAHSNFMMKTPVEMGGREYELTHRECIQHPCHAPLKALLRICRRACDLSGSGLRGGVWALAGGAGGGDVANHLRQA